MARGKVAYADFVTAMMAFILLLWLLSTVNEETLEGISDYFTPIAASTTSIGAGGEDMTDPGEGPSRDPTEDDIEEARRAQEEADFEEAAEELEQLIKGIPELSELSEACLSITHRKVCAFRSSIRMDYPYSPRAAPPCTATPGKSSASFRG